jgi:hypothetical protein
VSLLFDSLESESLSYSVSVESSSIILTKNEFDFCIESLRLLALF